MLPLRIFLFLHQPGVYSSGKMSMKAVEKDKLSSLRKFPTDFSLKAPPLARDCRDDAPDLWHVSKELRVKLVDGIITAMRVEVAMFTHERMKIGRKIFHEWREMWQRNWWAWWLLLFPQNSKIRREKCVRRKICLQIFSFIGETSSLKCWSWCKHS